MLRIICISMAMLNLISEEQILTWIDNEINFAKPDEIWIYQ